MDINRRPADLSASEWFFLVGPEKKSRRATWWAVLGLVASLILAVLLAVL